jgi:hypothetical protein
MTHYVYEIPTGHAANRQIGAFGSYGDASEFARVERQRLEFGDETLILVVFADSIERADASAAHLRLRFDEARRARQAPTGRVAQFKREYAEEKPEPRQPIATGTAVLEQPR